MPVFTSTRGRQSQLHADARLLGRPLEGTRADRLIVAHQMYSLALSSASGTAANPSGSQGQLTRTASDSKALLP